MLLLQLAQRGGDPLTDLSAARQQLLFLEHLQHRQRRRAGDRAAGIGAAQPAGGDHVHDLRLAAHPRQRKTAGDGLGKGGQVRHHAQLFHGEEAAGTSGAGLHLVGDQQDAVLVAQRAQALQEILRRHMETALALHRLDDDGGDVARLGVVLENAFDAGEGVIHAYPVQRARVLRTEHPAWHQAHAGGIGHLLAGQRQGHHGATVVAAGEGDHPGAAGGGAGDLHRVFHRLGAGGHQQGLFGEVAGHARGDLLAQLHIGLVGQHLEAGVRQLAELRLHGSDHLRVQVAGVEHGDAAGEVDVLAAFHVPHGGVLRTLGEDRVNLPDPARHGGHAALHQRFVALAHGRPHSPRHRYFSSRYSSMPYLLPSRPRPEAFTPPNGATSLEMIPVLMPTMPYSSASATRNTRDRSRA